MTEKAENKNQSSAAKKRKAAPAADENASSKENFSSEINEPRWSVVSFEKCAAKNLTYAQAAKKLKQLEAKKVAGLCIVTDEAAKRIFI